MMYLVIEIQKMDNGTVAVAPVSSYDSYYAALNKYHTVLAAAAVSSVAVHSAVILDETGSLLFSDSFSHAQQQSE